MWAGWGSYLPVQDLGLATEEAVAVVTAQVNTPLRACALEGRKTSKGGGSGVWGGGGGGGGGGSSGEGQSGLFFAAPRPIYPNSHTLSTAPHPLSLVQGLKYLELGPAAGAAELVDCAIDLVVVTGVREAAAAEAAGSGRAWGIERKGGRERERERERERKWGSHTEGVRQCRDGTGNPREDVVGAEVGQQGLL